MCRYHGRPISRTFNYCRASCFFSFLFVCFFFTSLLGKASVSPELREGAHEFRSSSGCLAGPSGAQPRDQQRCAASFLTLPLLIIFFFFCFFCFFLLHPSPLFPLLFFHPSPLFLLLLLLPLQDTSFLSLIYFFFLFIFHPVHWSTSLLWLVRQKPTGAFLSRFCALIQIKQMIACK